MRDVSNIATGIPTKVITVNNILETRDKIQELINEGHVKESLYVLAHDSKRTEHIVDHTEASAIGVIEEGIITAIANLFRSRGDELRAKLRSMGVSKEKAESLETEMDHGKIVILVWSGKMYYNEEYDPNISYYPYV